MDRNDITWRGYFAAAPTPFTSDGELDLPALREVLDYFIGEGAHGIVVNGSSGEWYAQRAAERRQVAEVAADAVAGRVPLIVGVSSIDPDETHALVAHAAQIPVDGVMCSPPPGWRLTVDEVIGYFTALSTVSELPIMLYNIPADVATDMAPTTLARLADLPNVVAVKDSTRDDRQLHETVRLAGDRLRVFGNLLTRPGLGLMNAGWNADGYIGGGMILGRDLARAMEATWDGRLDEAREIVDQLADLQSAINEADGNGVFGGIPGQLKATLNLLGVPAGYPRLPRRPVTDQTSLARLREVLAAHGVSAHGVSAPTAGAY